MGKRVDIVGGVPEAEDRERARLLAEVRTAYAASGLSAPVVAERAKVTDRTIRRLLSGDTCSPETLERVAAVLAVSRQRHSKSRTRAQSRSPSEVVVVPSEVPATVMGMKAASVVLGVSVASVGRAVAAHPPRGHRPHRKLWWPSAEAVREWWAAAREAA